MSATINPQSIASQKVSFAKNLKVFFLGFTSVIVSVCFTVSLITFLLFARCVTDLRRREREVSVLFIYYADNFLNNALIAKKRIPKPAASNSSTLPPVFGNALEGAGALLFDEELFEEDEEFELLVSAD